MLETRCSMLDPPTRSGGLGLAAWGLRNSALIGRAILNNVGISQVEFATAPGSNIVQGGNHAEDRPQKSALLGGVIFRIVRIVASSLVPHEGRSMRRVAPLGKRFWRTARSYSLALTSSRIASNPGSPRSESRSSSSKIRAFAHPRSRARFRAVRAFLVSPLRARRQAWS